MTFKDFTQSQQDSCIFIHNKFGYYILLYIDHITINWASTCHLTTLIKDLKMVFVISGLEEA